jgi:hypothetical protein
MPDIIELNHADSDVHRALASIGAPPMTYHTLGILPRDVTLPAPAPTPKLPRMLQLALPSHGVELRAAANAQPSWLARLLAREVVATQPADEAPRPQHARPTVDSLS